MFTPVSKYLGNPKVCGQPVWWFQIELGWNPYCKRTVVQRGNYQFVRRYVSFQLYRVL
jgi:hypothetical protein